MAQRNYVSLSKLGKFLENLSNKFAAISHKHSMSDITDYVGITVDSELSPTSANPVANHVLNAEFEAISDGMGALEAAIDDKADASHTHDDCYYTETEIDSKVATLNTAISGKANSSHTHDDRYYTESEVDDKLAAARTEISTEINEETDIINSQNGSYLNITDSAEANLLGYKLYGKSVQDGTPTPDAPIEIESVGEVRTKITGKNLLDVDEHLSMTGVLGINVNIPAGTYKMNIQGETHGGEDYPCIRFTANNVWRSFSVVGREQIITLTQNETKVYLYANGMSATASNGVNATIDRLILSVEGGAYEPYKEQYNVHTLTDTLKGIPVSSGGNYTDANGRQWVCDEVDFSRGVYVQRLKKTTLNSLGTPTLHSVTQGNLFRFSVSDVKQIQHASEKPILLCDSYICTSTSERVDKTISMEVQYSCIDFINNDYSDAASFKEAMKDVTVVYELATPIETPLTDEEIAQFRNMHTYEGVTHISTDSIGDIEAEYVRNTELGMDVVKMVEPLKTELNSHNQSANTITAGTFGGQVIANVSTQTADVSLLRNSKLVSVETNPTVNGEIYWTYE